MNLLEEKKNKFYNKFKARNGTKWHTMALENIPWKQFATTVQKKR